MTTPGKVLRFPGKGTYQGAVRAQKMDCQGESPLMGQLKGSLADKCRQRMIADFRTLTETTSASAAIAFLYKLATQLEKQL